MRDLLLNKIRLSMQHPQFITDVMKPMKIEEIIDQEVWFSEKICCVLEFSLLHSTRCINVICVA